MARTEPLPRRLDLRFDPFRPVWALLTNVKFALLLVGLAGAAGLLAVLIPQMPGAMRGSPAGRAAWLEARRETFGPFTDLMDAYGLFEVYHTFWFNGLWVLIIVAVTVCTVSRIPPVWRTVHRPPKRVPDAYFERARGRVTAECSLPADRAAAELARALRRRRFRVERVAETEGRVYLFADRFPWAQYGTFLSHLALLLLLIGAFLTKFAGFERVLALAETGAAAPVFTRPGPGQIFVEMVDAIEGRDAEGNIVDWRSVLSIRRGDEVVRCVTTVNDPCRAFGYRFHQAAFISDLVRLRITGPDGRPLYDDVFDFNGDVLFVPHLRVSAGGRLLLDQPIPQLEVDPGFDPELTDDDLALAAVALPAEAPVSGITVAWRRRDGDLLTLVQDASGETLPVAVRETVRFASGLEVELAREAAVPFRQVVDLPGKRDERVTVQMPTDSSGEPYLVLLGIEDRPVILRPGERYTTSSGYTYAFVRAVEGAGIDVRRDPGGTFIWVAVGMALVGLTVTFYVPRRRLWVRVGPNRIDVAGQAERSVRLEKELRAIVGEAVGEPPGRSSAAS